MEPVLESDGTEPSVYFDEKLQVPVRPLQRLRYPELTPDRFEREFASRSEPLIIEGLVSDWAALTTSWCERWASLVDENATLDCGFDPVDNRMMHFGDEEGDPSVLFNPGRLRMPARAFLEVGRLRQLILETRNDVDSPKRLDLKQRLNKEVEVQNMPFLSVDEDTPLHFFAPIRCRMRDLVPLSFYLSHDTYALPPEMQEDLRPQAERLLPGWGSPNSSRVWASNGSPWRLPYPPWSESSVPEPSEDHRIYSCFHCDRMENFHSIIAGQKEVVLVPPGEHDVLRSTRYSVQQQWLGVPVASQSGSYLGTTLLTSKQVECGSDQSAVHPYRPAEVNRKVSNGQWPDKVDFPVRTGVLHKGDTLYIPPYHWHWVATSTPPALGLVDEPLAVSVNFWWWPIHNDAVMEEWSFQNECDSLRNARVCVPDPPPERDSHGASLKALTARQRDEAAKPKSWPPHGRRMTSKRVDHEVSVKSATRSLCTQAESVAEAGFENEAEGTSYETSLLFEVVD